MGAIGGALGNKVEAINLVAGTGSVSNVPMATADTEYSHTFSTGLKRFCVRLRDTAILKLSFANGASGTTYFTVYAGEPFDSGFIDGTAITIYFQSPSASQTLEVIEWT